ncbi:MAG: hypothetical protein IPQ13_12205 [Holophagaceae bacterium]|nr:hypothetical protein [Holophagaceae bacterium]
MPQSMGGMRVEANLGDSEITLRFASREALEGFFKDALDRQAFLLRLDQAPEPFATFAFTAGLEGGRGLRFHATPVQTFPSGAEFEAAFQFADWSGTQDQQLESMLGQSGLDEPQDKASSAPVEAGEYLGTSPIFRIRELDVPQRVQLALKADRGERVILSRDTMAPVLLNLLSNPQLDSENVLAIAKSPYASPDILQRIASDRRWLASADIRIALVRNPKTPTPVAQRLLETLPLAELRTLAKVGNSKEDLRRLALGLVMKAHSSR